MLWRRRRSPPPVILPSLDRLSGLIERVVELVDAVAVAPVPAPEPVPEPPRELGPEPKPRAEVAEVKGGWIAFVSSPAGYRIVERDGPAPARGDARQLEDGSHRVLLVGPSPLPGDRRRCAYVEREEPPDPERSPDG